MNKEQPLLAFAKIEKIKIDIVYFPHGHKNSKNN
jgi:hypothetical protein